MSLDAYAFCPCGSGKKIKFCCSKDLVHDLDKVIRTIEGGQRAAARDLVDRLLAAHGDRAALLTLKGLLLLQTPEVAESELDETAARLLQSAPNNPSGLALQAAVGVLRHEPKTAVEKLQLALENTGEQGVPDLVYSVLTLVAQVLTVAPRHLPAALAHLMLALVVSEGDDPNVLQEFTALQRSGGPLPLRATWSFDMKAPADASWAAEFQDAMQAADAGHWRYAAEKLQPLLEQAPDNAALLRNLAICSVRLVDNQRAVDYLRRYSQLSSLPLHDAVAAEALAQLLDESREEPRGQRLRIEYPLQDVERAMEKLLSDATMPPLQVPPSRTDQDQPPPKAAFQVLDRPLPQTGVDIKREEIPYTQGELHVYGRQTDRGARLEVIVADSDADTLRGRIGELLGDLVGEPREPETVGEFLRTSFELSLNWRLPDDTPPRHVQALIREGYLDRLMNRWPDLPQAALDHKSLREAAGDEKYRLPASAAVLLVELDAENVDPEIDLNPLREQLGLPTVPPMEVPDDQVNQLSDVWYSRLVLDKLNDDAVKAVFMRSWAVGARQALRRSGQEMLRRDGSKQDVPAFAIYEMMLDAARDDNEARQWIAAGKQSAREQGHSVGRMLLAELRLCLEQGDGEQLPRVLEELKAGPMNEPRIAEAVMHLLQSYGLLRPGGMPPAPGATPSAPPDQAAPAPSGGIWTPGGGPATPAGGEQGKSKLWIPGMD